MTAPTEYDQVTTRIEKGSGLTIQEMDDNLISFIKSAFHVGFTTDWYGDIDEIPAGWVPCDGRALNKTGLYERLYAVLQGKYGSTSLTFNVPDVRGLFPRYWDGGSGIDPEAATRTAREDSAVTVDDAGTKQDDSTDLEGHKHYGMTSTSNPDTAGYLNTANTLTATQKGGGFDNGATNRGFNITPTLSPTGEPITNSVETRPANIATILIMRAY